MPKLHLPGPSWCVHFYFISERLNQVAAEMFFGMLLVYAFPADRHVQGLPEDTPENTHCFFAGLGFDARMLQDVGGGGAGVGKL